MPFQKELLDTMLLQYVVVVRMKKKKNQLDKVWGANTIDSNVPTVLT